MTSELTPFHLAMPVDDLEAARRFYRETLGCSEGRSAERWIDFDLYGHQLSLHLVDGAGARGVQAVDGDAVPVPHFGVVLAWTDWHDLRDRLVAAGTAFVIPPRIRFVGKPGEQATLFFRDPSGNALEFKSFREPGSLFATS
jgi:extradiol dioxygenase family protein